MASNNSILSTVLSGPERASLKDLQASQGWALLHRAVQELCKQAYRNLAREQDSEECRRLQGDIRAYEKVLGLPAELGRNPAASIPAELRRQ
jgi:hypothetical protein